MHKLAAVLLTLTLIPASVAFADKDFEDSGSHDCGTDPIVNVINSGGTYTLTGACTQINLNGGTLTVTIESVDELNINGASNKVDVTTLGALNLNGAKNKITWKQAKTGKKPKVAINGKSNSVRKIK